VQRKAIRVKNVVGVAEGHGPLAQETVVVGAHYDHLGYGGRSSLAKDKTKKEIHHGADDNASGTTAILELSRRFGEMPERQGRRLVFIAFSAEESGLLGSRYYCNYQPLFPLDKTVAMVNLDMVGRLNNNKVLIEGSGSAKTFDKLIEKLNGNPGFQLSKKPGGTGPSDHDSFYRSKIPVIFYWTGNHGDYHRPSDTADKINVPGMRRVTELAEKTVAHLAVDPEKLEYVFIKPKFTAVAGKMPKLGIMPNYEDGTRGILIDGVSDGGPAATAGMRMGDRIIEIAGRPVDDMDGYMGVMVKQKSGQPIQVSVIREGQKILLKVIPK
jgi:Zn-dependent M28 family amino/carboxypeptidase